MLPSFLTCLLGYLHGVFPGVKVSRHCPPPTVLAGTAVLGTVVLVPQYCVSAVAWYGTVSTVDVRVFIQPSQPFEYETRCPQTEGLAPRPW